VRHCARLCLLLLIGASLVPAAFAAGSPAERVRETTERILATVTDASLETTERQARIRAIIDERFDFETMSQSVLANHWQRATPAERARFTDFFSQYLEITYMSSIESYHGELIRYTGERIKGERAVVDTEITGGGAPVPVSYRLRLSNGEWYAYDVVIEGVSLVSNYRSTFAGIVKTEGIDGLLHDLEGRIDEYRKNRRP
jgi:phospholipid transport system substrate-binding protein